jgi:hypothetical protein
VFSGEKWLVACLAAAVCMARPACADPVVVTVGTHSLIMKDDALYPAARKFSFNVRSGEAPIEHQSQAPAAGSAGDPTLFGGTLVVYNGAGGSESFTIDLPAASWRVEGDTSVPGGYRYVFKATAPVWKVYVKGPKLSVRGGKAQWLYTLDEPSQGSIAVRLTLGTEVTYCSLALPRVSGSPPSSAAYDHVNKFQATRLQAAPDDCPPLP